MEDSDDVRPRPPLTGFILALMEFAIDLGSSVNRVDGRYSNNEWKMIGCCVLCYEGEAEKMGCK